MRMIFVNLVVKDLAASRAFWSELGFGFDETYSDDTAACLLLEENICAMLVTETRFRDFITGGVSDPFAGTQALYCLSVEDAATVDALHRKAVDAGAKPWKPAMDMGPMHSQSFQDLDGHVWELLSMPTEG